VEWQFRVAQGEKLPLNQEQIQLKGHAIEVKFNYKMKFSLNFRPESTLKTV
jgi:geranyl-CoA carboxylase alpha subunit